MTLAKSLCVNVQHHDAERRCNRVTTNRKGGKLLNLPPTVAQGDPILNSRAGR